MTIARRISKLRMANMVNYGRTPMLPLTRLAEIGYAVAIFSAAGFWQPRNALQSAYGDLLEHGTTSRNIPMYSFAEFNELIGYPDVWAFERLWRK